MLYTIELNGITKHACDVVQIELIRIWLGEIIIMTA